MLKPRLTQRIEITFMVDLEISPRSMRAYACHGADIRGVGRGRLRAGRRAGQGLLVPAVTPIRAMELLLTNYLGAKTQSVDTMTTG